MRVIYVAGPFRADTAWQIENNIRRAEEWSHKLWMMGAVVICPHTNTRFFHGEGTDEMWLEGTLELCRRADAIFLIENWQNSSGSRGEKAEMEKLERPIFYHDGDLNAVQAWIDAGLRHGEAQNSSAGSGA